MSSTKPTPQSPRVDLLPADVTQSLRIARIGRRTVVAALIMVFLAALAWWSAGPAIQSAQNQVADLQAQNARIQADVEALAPVGAFYGQLDRLEGLVSDTLASSPEAVQTLRQVKAAAKAAGDISFSKISLVYHGIPKSGDDLNRCPSPDPFAQRVTIGCIDFSAKAATRDEIARFIAALEKDPLFTGAYVSSTTSDKSQVTFTGSVGITLVGLVNPLSDDSVIAAITSTDDSTEEVSP